MVGCIRCHFCDTLKSSNGRVGIEVAVFVCHIQPCFHLFASIQFFARLFLHLDLRNLAVLIDLETVELIDKIPQQSPIIRRKRLDRRTDGQQGYQKGEDCHSLKIEYAKITKTL